MLQNLLGHPSYQESMAKAKGLKPRAFEQAPSAYTEHGMCETVPV